jgi:hypothetical protein
MAMSARDPLSVLFDGAARNLITRAYANKGQWTGVFLAPPSIAQRQYAARLGIYDLAARDRWGEPRWVRAYKRAVYYQLKRHGWRDGPRWGEARVSKWPAVALEWETGKLVYRAGWPSRRRAIRVRLHPGGAAARKATAAKPASEQWVGTGRQSTPADRDW